MSWEDLQNKDASKDEASREAQAQAAALAKNYAVCFSTQQGKVVLDHLVNSFIMANDTNLLAPNINYEAAYKNGEAGVIKTILNQLKRAQTL